MERLRVLCDERLSSSAIAVRLNEEGFHPPKRTKQFTSEMVSRLRVELDLNRRSRHGSTKGLGRDEYRVGGLARKMGIKRDTVRRWVKVKWVNVRRDEDGQQVIWADGAELSRLRELHGLPRTWSNKARFAKLKQPKQRPVR